MKSTSLTFLAGCIAVGLTACDSKKETTTVSTSADGTTVTTTTTEISDPGAKAFLEEYKGYAKDVAEAVKTGDAAKLQPLKDKAAELGAKGKEWLAKLKPEDTAAFKAKLEETAKSTESTLKSWAEQAMQKAAPALEQLKEAGKEKLDALKGAIGGEAPAAPAEAAPAPAAPAPGQ
jgi:NADH dehydrogenase/NADH:ubiquinone oxidoreductase subunit G